MKDVTVHLLNSTIAGALVFFGSLSTLFAGDPTIREIAIGLGLGFVTAMIIFLNKFGDWLKTQDDCSKGFFNFI